MLGHSQGWFGIWIFNAVFKESETNNLFPFHTFSFNRVVNIHGTHYLTVYNNVAYNIMGGAYFLEDGIEIGNRFDVSY